MSGHKKGGRDEKQKEEKMEKMEKRDDKKRDDSLSGGAVSPLMAGMIEKAIVEKTRVRLDGRLISEVTLVGEVKSVLEKEDGYLTIILSDSSGTAVIKHALDVNDPQMTEIHTGRIVRVVGVLRTLPTDGTIFVSAFHTGVRAIEETLAQEELDFHAADVQLFHHLCPPKPSNTTNGTKNSSMNSNLDKHDRKADNRSDNRSVSGTVGVVGTPAVKTQEGEFGQQVMKVLTGHPNAESETGVTVVEILQAFPDKSESDVQTALNRLQSNGLLYTTIDESHFKSTNTYL
jgi:hypothetical protein